MLAALLGSQFLLFCCNWCDAVLTVIAVLLCLLYYLRCLPGLGPVLLLAAIFYFVYCWNKCWAFFTCILFYNGCTSESCVWVAFSNVQVWICISFSFRLINWTFGVKWFFYYQKTSSKRLYRDIVYIISIRVYRLSCPSVTENTNTAK